MTAPKPKHLRYIFNRMTGTNPDKMLIDAIKQGDKSLLQKAFDKGANPNKFRWHIILEGNIGPGIDERPFTLAVHKHSGGGWRKEKKDLELIETMLKNGADPNQRDYHYGDITDAYTPLRYAASNDLSDLADLLKKYGGDVDYSINSKSTITPLAAETLQSNGRNLSYDKTLVNLIAWGADINKPCFEEKLTPLQLKTEQLGQTMQSPYYALFSNNDHTADLLKGVKDVCSILIDAGANPLVINPKTGMTPLQTVSDTIAKCKSLFAVEYQKTQTDDPEFKQAADDLIQLLTTAEANWKKRSTPAPKGAAPSP